MMALILPLLLLYPLPWFIAWRRGHRNTTAIFFANLLLGWTGIGWVACVAWALTN